MKPPKHLPYRRNVGAVLFNAGGLVFVARRADFPNAEGPAGGWQLPQGGIDEDEDPRARGAARTGGGDRHRPRRDHRRAPGVADLRSAAANCSASR